ncbi:MAG: thioredoxin family protein [Daejeonella sp.]
MKKLITLCFLVSVFIAKAQSGGYSVGDIASDFKLQNVDSKLISLSDYKEAKGFIVVFTCNTCPYSKAYEDRIISLDKKYKSKGYPVIAINPNDPEVQPGDSFDAMKTRAKSKNYTFPYLSDPNQTITKKYGAQRTPQLYILEKTDRGNVVQYVGAIDDDTENSDPNKISYAGNAVDALLSGKKPMVNFTKAVGCTIKWKKKQG